MPVKVLWNAENIVNSFKTSKGRLLQNYNLIYEVEGVVLLREARAWGYWSCGKTGPIAELLYIVVSLLYTMVLNLICHVNALDPSVVCCGPPTSNS